MVMCVSLLALSCFAQDDLPVDGPRDHKQKQKDKDPEKTPFSERLFTGGDLALNFGTVTLVNVSPILGYWVTEEKYAVGVGAVYQYYNNHLYQFTTSVYGGNVFNRYYFGENFFLHGEYELLNVEAFDGFHDRVWVPGLLGGGGYHQPLGDRSAFTVMVLYNFTKSNYTPYRNPVIRAGVNIGL